MRVWRQIANLAHMAECQIQGQASQRHASLALVIWLSVSRRFLLVQASLVVRSHHSIRKRRLGIESFVHFDEPIALVNTQPICKTSSIHTGFNMLTSYVREPSRLALPFRCFQLLLRLLVVFRCVDTMLRSCQCQFELRVHSTYLIVIYQIGPWYDMCQQG